MQQMEKAKVAKDSNGRRLSLRSREKNKKKTYVILIYTEKGEILKYRVPLKRGIYKISEKDGIPYTHIKITSNIRVNSKIALYSQEGVVSGIVKRIAAAVSGPSTDVGSGDIPPIKRPGGH